MAKASVEMTCPTCGKTYTWSTTKYNRREANSWESWAAGQERECPECYAETMKRKREEEAQKAIEDAKTNPFGIDVDALDLKGSEKQNAWAKKIIAGVFPQLEIDYFSVVKRACKKPDPNPKPLTGLARKLNITPKIFDEAARDKYCEILGISTALTDEERAKIREDVNARLGVVIKSLTAREIIDNRDLLSEEIINRAAKNLRAEIAPEAASPKTEETPEEVKPQPKAEPPKTEWKKFAFNIQNIAHETDNGILIQMPHNSEYDSFQFWTSKKLTREGRHSYEMLLSVNETMKFKLQKTGNGKHNRFKVIAEQEITADELAEAFGGYCEAPNAPKIDTEREEIIRHTPEPLDPIEDAEADPELTR